ncbi:methionyl-tRNA formyltransferase [uncultured Croceitalea sp.]|uniref:methionyl-tRNA formyltransferase n=1 Tax=uncultured Croceitalea sp. TaxID=1798908 RepID=UPI0033064C56
MSATTEKRDLRIVFMGTPEFAVAGLAHLLENNYTVVGVVTAPDRPAGRGRKLQESAVKKYALEKGLPVLQPTNLKSEAFIASLAALEANLQIVVAFRMLPKVVWQMPKFGTFNLHASLLPQYRGAAPINWAIINGETKTGVTTFFIDEKIDTGQMILQKATEISPNETAGQLHDRLMHLGAEVIVQTVALIEDNAVTLTKQPEDQTLKPAHKIYRETCKIDWSKPLHNVYNHIRGLSPYPTAWTTLTNTKEDITLKIYGAEPMVEAHQLRFGTVIADKQHLKVAVKDGYINLLEVQLPGKRKMAIKEVLNGFSVEKEAYMR